MNDDIVIIGGYCTITGALLVLQQEGATIHRRTILRWLARNGIQTRKIGATTVFPQSALRQLVEDYGQRTD